jgi:hypothetical protein
MSVPGDSSIVCSNLNTTSSAQGLPRAKFQCSHFSSCFLLPIYSIFLLLQRRAEYYNSRLFPSRSVLGYPALNFQRLCPSLCETYTTKLPPTYTTRQLFRLVQVNWTSPKAEHPISTAIYSSRQIVDAPILPLPYQPQEISTFLTKDPEAKTSEGRSKSYKTLF